MKPTNNPTLTVNKPKVLKASKPEKDVVTKEVDVLLIGGGPAALGFMLNAYKTNR